MADEVPPVDEQKVPPAGPAGEPAFVLAAGVGYVRGWAEAHHAVERLREALRAAGLADRVPGVRADVTVAGVGVVELGRITPQTARQLAALLATARAADADRAA